MEGMEIDAPTGSHPVLDQPFKSKLQDAPQRFLAYVIEHGLKHGRRSATDFIRHFSPAIIMEGLEDEPLLRAKIMVAATGVRMKVAQKKSASSCGSDLQIALDEHETDPDTVVRLFEPDDRVRFLDNRALWAFLTEGEFWQVEAKKDPKGHALAASHISYFLERALEDQLLTHRDVVKGITVASMTELLPRSELPKIIEAALQLGEAKKPFVERNLLEALGIGTLTQHIPLASIWTQVVVPCIAEAHGLVKKVEEGPQFELRVPEKQRPSAGASPQPASAQPASAQVSAAQASAPQASTAQASAPQAPAPQTPAVAQPKAAPAPAARPAPSPVASSAAAASPANAPKAAAADQGSGLDLEVDELLSSLTGGGKTAKKSVRRPGSVPPTV